MYLSKDCSVEVGDDIRVLLMERDGWICGKDGSQASRDDAKQLLV